MLGDTPLCMDFFELAKVNVKQLGDSTVDLQSAKQRCATNMSSAREL